MNIENNIKESFVIIKKLNDKMNNNIITNDEILEQEENIQEIPEIMNRFNNVLINIEKLDIENTEKILSELIQLHLVIGDIEWQYDQLHEIIRKTLSAIEYQNTNME